MLSVSKNKLNTKINSKIKNILDCKEVKEQSESEGMLGKRSISKGDTPSATTAATSRQTLSPKKKLIVQDCVDDIKREAFERSLAKKLGGLKSTQTHQVQASVSIPKRLESTYKSRRKIIQRDYQAKKNRTRF
jgi:uncharacterized protein YbcC (UPF0753/DUF2309 family)